MLIDQTIYIKSILPNHYICKALNNGVLCYSTTDQGIDEYNEKHIWESFLVTLKQKYKFQLLEINHIINFNHKKFVVYLNIKKKVY